MTTMLKRGDVRDDGYRFNGYTKAGKEHWLSPAVYEKVGRYSVKKSPENREKINEKARYWYSLNSEKAKASTQKWRKANPEKIRAQKTAWMQVPENRMKHILMQAKRRAASSGLDFDITLDDLLPLPSICPVFGTPINYQGTGARGFANSSASIDRFDSSKGYVKGNVRVISWRANRLKSDATLEEIEALAAYMKKEKN